MCRSKLELSFYKTINAVVYQKIDARAEQYIKEISELASYICKCQCGYVSILDFQGKSLQTRIGNNIYCLPFSDNIIKCINKPGKVYQFAEINAVDPMIIEQVGSGSLRWFSAGVALISAEGTWVGALWMADIDCKILDEDQQHKLLLLGSQLINYLEDQKHVKVLETEIIQLRNHMKTLNSVEGKTVLSLKLSDTDPSKIVSQNEHNP